MDLGWASQVAVRRERRKGVWLPLLPRVPSVHRMPSPPCILPRQQAAPRARDAKIVVDHKYGGHSPAGRLCICAVAQSLRDRCGSLDKCPTASGRRGAVWRNVFALSPCGNLCRISTCRPSSVVDAIRQRRREEHGEHLPLTSAVFPHASRRDRSCTSLSQRFEHPFAAVTSFGLKLHCSM
jgi:hypothetical protein